MSRNSLAIMLLSLVAAIGLPGPARAEAIGSAAFNGPCYGSEKCAIGEVESLPNFASNLDSSSDMNSASISDFDMQVRRTENFIVLEEPICIHNCTVPEPGSGILLVSALISFGLRRRYTQLR